MDLKAAILKEHSKEQCAKIVRYIGSDKNRFKELFELFSGDDQRVTQRAAWPLSYIVIAHPPLIHPYFSKMLKLLDRPGAHDAIKRNITRLLQDIEIPEKHQGVVMDKCFQYINDPAMPSATKAFSLTVLENLCEQYPEIKPELITSIEERIDLEKPAYVSRAKKILKRFK